MQNPKTETSHPLLLLLASLSSAALNICMCACLSAGLIEISSAGPLQAGSARGALSVHVEYFDVRLESVLQTCCPGAPGVLLPGQHGAGRLYWCRQGRQGEGVHAHRQGRHLHMLANVCQNAQR